MSIYVNQNNGFEQAEPLTRECPHCGAHAQLLPVAAPPFALLAQTRPKNTGLVFRCAACNEPRFLRAAVRAIGSDRVELAPNLVEVERTRERFQYARLPERAAELLRETLECYSMGVHNAFATMCRRTTRTALAELDASSERRWREATHEILRVCEVDAVTANTIDSVLFGDDSDPPAIGPDEAAVLVEVLKDLFYQNFVRTAKLKAAMKMRRYFAGESGTVTPIERNSRRELA